MNIYLKTSFRTICPIPLWRKSNAAPFKQFSVWIPIQFLPNPSSGRRIMKSRSKYVPPYLYISRDLNTSEECAYGHFDLNNSDVSIQSSSGVFAHNCCSWTLRKWIFGYSISVFNVEGQSFSCRRKPTGDANTRKTSRSGFALAIVSIEHAYLQSRINFIHEFKIDRYHVQFTSVSNQLSQSLNISSERKILPDRILVVFPMLIDPQNMWSPLRCHLDFSLCVNSTFLWLHIRFLMSRNTKLIHTRETATAKLWNAHNRSMNIGTLFYSKIVDLLLINQSCLNSECDWFCSALIL